MSNRNNYCGPNRFSQNYRSSNSNNEHDRYKLPAINNGTTKVPNINSSSITRPCIPQVSNTNNPSLPANIPSDGSTMYNARPPSSNNYKINCPPSSTVPSQIFSSTPVTSNVQNTIQQAPVNKSLSSNQFIGSDKTNTDVNKNLLINQANSSSTRRPMTSGPGGFNYSSSNMNIANGQKTIVRDRLLASEILQKAGITSNLTPNDCLEVITDVPVTMNDNVNCDPNPLCMKKPAESQECYEQSIFVRHLQPPRPLVPAPIIIREHYAQQSSSSSPSSQAPIVIRQIPPRPSTPPPLIIRQCPPPMIDLQEPTIIDREVPPPPRQVIVEQFPTPAPKPRSIILEKWVPYEEPENRPCIVEKAAMKDVPPPKNIIIQYEAIEPKIQPQYINEGISYVDPKQFVNDRPNGNAEVCYVDQLNNLPDHIKCQLSPQVLAAIGIQNDDKQNTNTNPHVAPTNSTAFYQQHEHVPSTSVPPMPLRNPVMANGCHSVKPPYSQLGNPNMYRRQQQQQRPLGNRAHSASAAGSSRCYNKYTKSIFTGSGNQVLNNLSRAHYNPWATTYQVSYTNKARGLCRAR